MADDLVKRLRDKNCCDASHCNCDEAADRIEALEAALRELGCKCSSNCEWERDEICPSWVATAALAGEKKE